MKRDKEKRVYRQSPARILTLFFFTIITIGAFLLNTPFATVSGERIGLLNAYFTATSAVCVTGLIVVDTSAVFSLFGQIVVMLLIQCGGIGIMIFASIIYGFLRRKMSIANMLVMREALNQDNMATLTKTITNVVKLTFFIEGIGAVLLAIRFIPEFGLVKGTFYSVFHSVSAFCNAGFDLMDGNFTSITAYMADPLIVLTISGLIIGGGIGFAVTHEVLHRKHNRKLSLQARVVFGTTAFLLVAGTLGIYALERTNPLTLGDPNMSEGVRWLSAFFQSVTCRTAGFNTIDQAGMRTGSKLLSMGLMFVGASPASTGGGIKTTTFAIIVLACIALIKQQKEITFKYKRVSQETVMKAFVTATVSLGILCLCTFVIACAEPNVGLVDIMYESFSAVATVGITTGITSTLGNVSKIALILTMFAGRVGPITLTMAFAGEGKKKVIKNIEAGIMIG